MVYFVRWPWILTSDNERPGPCLSCPEIEAQPQWPHLPPAQNLAAEDLDWNSWKYVILAINNGTLEQARPDTRHWHCCLYLVRIEFISFLDYSKISKSSEDVSTTQSASILKNQLLIFILFLLLTNSVPLPSNSILSPLGGKSKV